ncbi:MAG: hypothetical protein RMJ98_14730 [Myxococcales bacterium]|nr:hypothetical protein [Polyangiaceae bacterium]MDW8250548.1 hypothetical protein [Myxococcales bacterium]
MGVGALLGITTTAQAQSAENFGYARPFPGTVRDLLREDLARTSAQLYGAVGMLDHHVFHKKQSLVAVSEMNILTSALKIPGTGSGYGYKMLPADVYSYSAVFAARHKHLGVFASAGFVYPRVAEAGEALGARLAIPMVGVTLLPLTHLFMAGTPFLTGPLRVTKNQSLADKFSYVIGGSYELYGVSLYAGLIGTGRGGGLYTNINENRLRLLLSTAWLGNFEELAYLKGGFSEIPGLLGKGKNPFASSSPPNKSEDKDELIDPTDSLTSFYGRQIKFTVPRRGAAPVEQAVDPGKASFWSTHLEQKNLLWFLDAAVALGVSPTVLLHEARVILHTPREPNSPEVSLSVGAVRLPALYMLAQQPGVRWAFRLEFSLPHRRTGSKLLSLSFYRNEPEILTAFPYAYDAWAITLLANPLFFIPVGKG